MEAAEAFLKEGAEAEHPRLPPFPRAAVGAGAAGSPGAAEAAAGFLEAGAEASEDSQSAKAAVKVWSRLDLVRRSSARCSIWDQSEQQFAASRSVSRGLPDEPHPLWQCCRPT